MQEKINRLQEIIATSENTHVLETTELEACSKLELIHKLSELYQKYTTLAATNITKKNKKLKFDHYAMCVFKKMT